MAHPAQVGRFAESPELLQRARNCEMGVESKRRAYGDWEWKDFPMPPARWTLDRVLSDTFKSRLVLDESKFFFG
jgi:hypothetical protein